MQQLSGLDAAFLYLETANAPMHIGGVSILDAEGPEGPFTLERLRDLMASRLGVARTFRQRLAPVPLNLGRPYWVQDQDFDLDRHVQRTRLPEPGGWKELAALMAWELAQPLDRSRPLWELLYVDGLALEGLPQASAAVISKIHHAAIDGVSGSEIMAALYDPSPETPPPRSLQEPAAAPEEPEEEEENEPGTLRLLRLTSRNLARYYGSIPGAVGDALKGAARSSLAWGLHHVQPPPMLFTAPRTRFNAAVGRRRVWGGKVLDLERIKALSRAATRGSEDPKERITVNDVVLAVCAGALRRYLEGRGELPEDPLVAMVPVSVRAGEAGSATGPGSEGNQVSAMLVSLATDEADPGRRLERIHESSLGSKVYHQAIGARTLTDSAQLIPFSVAGLATRLYTRLHLAEKHKPLFNLVITNVPGPQVPLYVGGARLLAHVGAAPIFDGVGLILPIFSYHGTLAIGAVSCPEMLPDTAVFMDFLEEALGELEEAFPRP